MPKNVKPIPSKIVSNIGFSFTDTEVLPKIPLSHYRKVVQLNCSLAIQGTRSVTLWPTLLSIGFSFVEISFVGRN